MYHLYFTGDWCGPLCYVFSRENTAVVHVTQAVWLVVEIARMFVVHRHVGRCSVNAPCQDGRSPLHCAVAEIDSCGPMAVRLLSLGWKKMVKSEERISIISMDIHCLWIIHHKLSLGIWISVGFRRKVASLPSVERFALGFATSTQLRLCSRADQNQQDRDGLTPLDYLKSQGVNATWRSSTQPAG